MDQRGLGRIIREFALCLWAAPSPSPAVGRGHPTLCPSPGYPLGVGEGAGEGDLGAFVNKPGLPPNRGPHAASCARLIWNVRPLGTTRLGMAMTDPSPTAAEIQVKIHGRLTGSQRLKIALEISLAARQMALTRLRQRHPEWSGPELRREPLRYSFAPGTLPPVLR